LISSRLIWYHKKKAADAHPQGTKALWKSAAGGISARMGRWDIFAVRRANRSKGEKRAWLRFG
jgi:hypothetical protein